MCGIAGILNNNGATVTPELISRMTDAAEHRGPDGRGIFISDNLALGHRRLSIIDLSDLSAQPMNYLDRYIMVFNGEIYNYIELRSELLSAGYHFRSTGDAEVLMASYDYWGTDCVKRFNGMWAFAIFDRKDKNLFCSRDRFGIKPFYYATQGNSFLFASEIKQLLAVGVKPKVNLSILADYLVLGFEEHRDETFFAGIRKLSPGHSMVIDTVTGQHKISRYYQIQLHTEITNMDFRDASELLNIELNRSVLLRLRSDVKVGTCLSGGIDSSVIASLAAIAYSATGPFTAITAGNLDRGLDEREYARMVVNRYGMDHRITVPDIGDFKGAVAEVVRTQEEPFGSPSILMQYFVMKTAREAGCPVLLDGQGGDELFLGYQRYYPAWLTSLAWYDKPGGWLKSTLNSGVSLYRNFLNSVYFKNPELRIRSRLGKCSFLKESFTGLISRDIVKQIADSYNDIASLQNLEVTKTQLPHLLRYEDRNSMHFSIETRLPFLDYKVVETALSMRHEYKIKKGYTKFILRKSMESVLPEEIAWRKNKIGFEAPTEIWMRGDLSIKKSIRESNLLKEISKSDIQYKEDNAITWRLFNIAKWEEVFNVT